MIITWDGFIAKLVNRNNSSSLPIFWDNSMGKMLSKISNNTGASSVAQLTSSEEGTKSGPAAEFGESSGMASIMISSFSMISV